MTERDVEGGIEHLLLGLPLNAAQTMAVIAAARQGLAAQELLRDVTLLFARRDLAPREGYTEHQNRQEQAFLDETGTAHPGHATKNARPNTEYRKAMNNWIARKRIVERVFEFVAATERRELDETTQAPQQQGASPDQARKNVRSGQADSKEAESTVSANVERRDELSGLSAVEELAAPSISDAVDDLVERLWDRADKFDRSLHDAPSCKLFMEAASRLKQQAAEIERLDDLLDASWTSGKNGVLDLRAQLSEARAEIERLSAEIELLRNLGRTFASRCQRRAFGVVAPNALSPQIVQLAADFERALASCGGK